MTQRRNTTKINWVLRFLGIEGNEKTEKAAKETTDKVDTRRYPERFASLSHVRHTISERMWKVVKHWFQNEITKHPPLQITRYDPALENQEPDMVAIEMRAQVSRPYFQLMSG